MMNLLIVLMANYLVSTITYIMLMFDRITEINDNKGAFKGILKAELDIKKTFGFLIVFKEASCQDVWFRCGGS